MPHFLILLFFSLYLTATVHSALVTVAENLPTPLDTSRFSDGFGNASPSGSIYDNSAGQTFTATGSGHLYQIKATVDIRPSTPNAPVKIVVMSVVNGLPTDVLAISIVPISAVPAELPSLFQGNSFTIAATFDETLTLTAGTQYAILFTSGEGGSANYGVWGLSGDSDEYAGGVRFTAQNSSEFTIQPTWRGDYFFQVITSTPETSSLVLGGLAGMFFITRRCRNTSKA